MSTVSGVFPNAITPSFAASSDPMQQTRVRRDNETAVFAPVDAVENSSAMRPAMQEQPGRLEAEQTREIQSRLTPDSTSNEGSENSETAQTQGDPITIQAQERQQQARQDEARLEQELAMIRELATRDREVRNHEQAHQAVGGQYAGSMDFIFKQGPDGKRYAVGGEVSIDVSPIPGDPEATMDKAQLVRRAALAPAEPSAQDRSVAALASQIYVDARSDMRQMERMEAEKNLEERSQQQSLNNEDVQQTEVNVQSDEEADEQASAKNEERLQEILEQTSESVVAALEAAYRDISLQEIGFNLDTRV